MMGSNVLAATTSSSSGGFGSAGTLILILVVIVGFYMLMIRPQRRRQQQVQQRQNTVRPGATVRTTAGMYATVTAVDGDDVVLEVAPGVEVRYLKRAIMDVVSPGEDTEEAEDSYEEADAEDEDQSEETAEADDAADADAADVDEDTPAHAPAESGSGAKD
jgi:preprotein translocase subunit YajC